jgi:zinc-finger of acetyl-transferase ESCO
MKRNNRAKRNHNEVTCHPHVSKKLSQRMLHTYFSNTTYGSSRKTATTRNEINDNHDHGKELIGISHDTNSKHDRVANVQRRETTTNTNNETTSPNTWHDDCIANRTTILPGSNGTMDENHRSEIEATKTTSYRIGKEHIGLDSSCHDVDSFCRTDLNEYIIDTIDFTPPNDDIHNEIGNESWNLPEEDRNYVTNDLTAAPYGSVTPDPWIDNNRKPTTQTDKEDNDDSYEHHVSMQHTQSFESLLRRKDELNIEFNVVPERSTDPSSSNSHMDVLSKTVSLQPKKRIYEQLYLDLGQKDFGKQMVCHRCGMMFVHGVTDDAKQHQTICVQYQKGVPFVLSKKHGDNKGPKPRVVDQFTLSSTSTKKKSETYQQRPNQRNSCTTSSMSNQAFVVEVRNV